MIFFIYFIVYHAKILRPVEKVIASFSTRHMIIIHVCRNNSAGWVTCQNLILTLSIRATFPFFRSKLMNPLSKVTHNALKVYTLLVCVFTRNQTNDLGLAQWSTSNKLWKEFVVVLQKFTSFRHSPLSLNEQNLSHTSASMDIWTSRCLAGICRE